MRKKLHGFCGFSMNLKVFPTSALSNASTFNTDEAKVAKVFGWNPVNCKTFSHLNFVAYSIEYTVALLYIVWVQIVVMLYDSTTCA